MNAVALRSPLAGWRAGDVTVHAIAGADGRFETSLKTNAKESAVLHLKACQGR